MLDALSHRGPDGKGLWWRDDMALGHHRLAIHDLSAFGAQPMESDDGRHVLVINGTIHNAPELRADPACLRYRFRGRSDSEVLLPLWATHGMAMLPRLRGPFALAIWDTHEQSLVLARDRFGKKPLYWTRTADDGVLFASELRALMAAGGDRRYDRTAAAAFLRTGYVPGHGTILDGVHQLPPAGWMRVTADGRESATFREPVSQSSQDFEENLRHAVSIRTRTDREIGVLLSGGLDSTTIATLAARRGEHDAPLRSFTLGFDDPRFDERPAAAATAKHLGLDHHGWRFDVAPGPLLQEIVTTTGELLADSSILPTTLICRRARDHATVLLCGDGADELLIGYRRHAVARWSQKLGPARHLAAMLAPLTPGVRRRQGVAALSRDPRAALADLVGLVPHRTLRPWLHPDLRAAPDPLLASFADIDHDESGDGLASTIDLKTYLPGDLLPKIDRASMLSGVDVWSPFLDPDVAAWARAQSPNELRGKRPLRALLRKLDALPATLQRKKQGFGVPLLHWLREGSYGAFAADVLGDVKAPFEGVLANADAAPILDRVRHGDDALAPLAHACVVLALWWDAFMETKDSVRKTTP